MNRWLETDTQKTARSIINALNESAAGMVKKEINKDKPEEAPKNKKVALEKRITRAAIKGKKPESKNAKMPKKIAKKVVKEELEPEIGNSIEDQIADLQDYLDNTPEVSDEERAEIQAEIDDLISQLGEKEVDNKIMNESAPGTDAYDKLVQGDDVYFRNEEGVALLGHYADNYPEPEEYDEGFKPEYGGTEEGLQKAKEAAANGDVWEFMEVFEDTLQPMNEVYAYVYGQDDLMEMLKTLRQVNVVKKLEESENTNKEEYLKQLAQDSYDTGHPYDRDDFNEFKKICAEDGYEMTEVDFNKYFEYFDDCKEELEENQIEDARKDSIEKGLLSEEESIENERDLAKYIANNYEDITGIEVKEIFNKDENGPMFNQSIVDETSPAIEKFIKEFNEKNGTDFDFYNEDLLNLIDEELASIKPKVIGEAEEIISEFKVGDVVKVPYKYGTYTPGEFTEAPIIDIEDGRYVTVEIPSKLEVTMDQLRKWNTLEESDNEPKTVKEYRIMDGNKVLKTFSADERSKGYAEMRAMGKALRDAGKEDNLIYKEFTVKNKLKEAYSDKRLNEEYDSINDNETYLRIINFIDNLIYSVDDEERKQICAQLKKDMNIFGSLDESLKEAYSEKFGGDPKDFIGDLISVKHQLSKLNLDGFGSHLARQMVEDFIDTCDRQIKKAKRLASGDEFYTEADDRTYKDRDEAEYYRNKELYANSNLARHREAMEKAKKACKEKGIKLDESEKAKPITETKKIIVGENYNESEDLSLEEKVARLKLMDQAARSCNDEKLVNIWLTYGIPDGETEDGFEDDANVYERIEKEFKNIMQQAVKDKLFGCPKEALAIAKEYAPEIENIPDNVTAKSEEVNYLSPTRKQEPLYLVAYKPEITSVDEVKDKYVKIRGDFHRVIDVKPEGDKFVISFAAGTGTSIGGEFEPATLDEIKRLQLYTENK